MTELNLYQFLKENEIEMRWDGDVLSTWLSRWNLEEFTKLISSALDEGGVEARLLSGGSVWVDLVPICEYYGIEPERIFAAPISAFA